MQELLMICQPQDSDDAAVRIGDAFRTARCHNQSRSADSGCANDMHEICYIGNRLRDKRWKTSREHAMRPDIHPDSLCRV
jgi:hypothetical protein